jgi:hypothetical protein
MHFLILTKRQGKIKESGTTIISPTAKVITFEERRRKETPQKIWEIARSQ